MRNYKKEDILLVLKLLILNIIILHNQDKDYLLLAVK